MPRRDEELDAFKRRVNLTEYAATLGYAIDRNRKPQTINGPGVITVTGSYSTIYRENRVQMTWMVICIAAGYLVIGPPGIFVGSL